MPALRPLAIALAAALSACVAGASDRPAGAPEPPAPLPEIRYAAPAPGMAWIPGAWRWNGADYVWVPGRWETPPPTP
jgi:hypothetical protein